VAVNSVGAVTLPDSPAFWASPFEIDGEFGGVPFPAAPFKDGQREPYIDAKIGGNTTIGIVATNAQLDRQGARRLAIMAQDGYARAIRPSHTPFDGDTVFAVSTGAVPLEPEGPMGLARVGALAADCMARAVARGVYEATAINEIPSYRDVYGPAKP